MEQANRRSFEEVFSIRFLHAKTAKKRKER